MVAHTIDRRGEKKNKRKRAVEEITASLGHINRQKNVTNARKDDKRRGSGSGIWDLPRANTRESEKRWMDNDWFGDTAQKEKRKNNNVMATLYGYFAFVCWWV